MQQRAERHVEGMAGVSERRVDHVETMHGPAKTNAASNRLPLCCRSVGSVVAELGHYSRPLRPLKTQRGRPSGTATLFPAPRYVDASLANLKVTNSSSNAEPYPTR